MDIQVKLQHITPLHILINAIRTCYDSFDKSDSSWYVSKDLKSYNANMFDLGSKDKALIERIIDSQHHSCLEHIVFNFEIKGISRLVLQELARHRIASYSVKSTRYTLSRLKHEQPFLFVDIETEDELNKRIEKYINLTGIPQIDSAAIDALEKLRQLIYIGVPNDKAKYALPESMKTDLYWTINARSLQNFLTLRLSPKAHFEIRELALQIYKAIPSDYKLLFKNINIDESNICN